MSDPTPLDKAWWQAFAASFMEQGDGGSATPPEGLTQAIDSAHDWISSFVDQVRAGHDEELNAALKEFNERLDRIESRLNERPPQQ